MGSASKEPTYNVGDLRSIPRLGRSPGEENGYPLQYSGLENSMGCVVHGVAKSGTRLSDFHFHFSRRCSTAEFAGRINKESHYSWWFVLCQVNNSGSLRSPLFGSALRSFAASLDILPGVSTLMLFAGENSSHFCTWRFPEDNVLT